MVGGYMPLTDQNLTATMEVIHGVPVQDPYRWLEDRDLPETEAWIRDQQLECDSYFAECTNLTAIQRRVREYLDVEVIDQPVKAGSAYFFRKRSRFQEQACIYVQSDVAERRLVDPAPLGSFASVAIHRIASEGSLLAYEAKIDGSDKKSIHILDVANGHVLRSHIQMGYARGFAFSPDLLGFYYCHELLGDAGDHAIKFQSIDSADDEVCFRIARSGGSRLILLSDEINLGAAYIRNQSGKDIIDLWITQKRDPHHWHHVLARRNLPFTPILRDGRLFALEYERDRHGSVVEIDSMGNTMRVVVPAQEAAIRGMTFTGSNVFIHYLEGLKSSIQRWHINGKHIGEISVPANATIHLLPTLTDSADCIFYSYQSYQQPPTILEYRCSESRTTLWHQRTMPSHAPTCSVKEAIYTSLDGTPIPITLVIPEAAGKESVNPVVMTTYGGFGASMTPQFSVLVSIMLELGAIFVVPHVRGGGDCGKEWAAAASGRSRQVAFDDFISAAEWLLHEGITRAEKLAIFGGSHSGLLVAVAMTQRPELFQAVVSIAPLLDMVRYEVFDDAKRWRSEFGTVEDPEDFKALLAYSPYHHVIDSVKYPAALFISGDSDDRCNPAHTRKMVGRLRGRSGRHSRAILDYTTERGHSPVLPLSVRVDALARRIAFLGREVGIVHCPWGS
jgi:prolyl oligopeptidase